MPSVCPYCAVGCGQRVYVKDDASCRSRAIRTGRIPRPALPERLGERATRQSPGRATTMLYRAPRSSAWQRIGVDEATDMIVDRMIESRTKRWQDHDEHGKPLRRTMGLAALGGPSWTTKRTT